MVSIIDEGIPETINEENANYKRSMLDYAAIKKALQERNQRIPFSELAFRSRVVKENDLYTIYFILGVNWIEDRNI